MPAATSSARPRRAARAVARLLPALALVAAVAVRAEVGVDERDSRVAATHGQAVERVANGAGIAGVADAAGAASPAGPARIADAAAAAALPGLRSGARSLLRWIDTAPEVHAVTPWVHEAASTHGVDAELLTALIAVESRFRPDVVAPGGAIGLMQLTARTANRYATPEERRLPPKQRLLDARTNIHTGARLLADLVRRYERVELALAAWNGGEGLVRREGGMPQLPRVRVHVERVLELYWALLQNRLVPAAAASPPAPPASQAAPG